MYVYLKIKRLKRLIYSLFFICRLKEFGRNVRFRSVKEFKGGDCISIGDNTYFSNDLYMTVWKSFTPTIEKKQSFCPELRIGSNCNFGAYNHITCINKICIGNGVLTGKWVTITDNNHGCFDIEELQKKPMERELTSKGAVVIKDNVWIGDKVTILGGITIGKGAIVAANSVVTKDIPDYSMVAGIPARVIRKVKL